MSTTADDVGRARLPALRALLRNTQATAHSAVADLEARPDPVAGLHRSGRRPYRVLMFGGGVLEGRGLRTHNLGLPGHVADLLAARSGRGVDLDVIVDADPTGNRALNGLRGMRLNRYDAVVVVLGERYAVGGVPEGKWEILFASLAQVLLSQTAKVAPIFVWDAAHVSHPLGTDRYDRSTSGRADRLGAITEQTCALTQRIRYRRLVEPLQPREVGSRFAPDTYEEWADNIVSRLYPQLVEADGHLGPESARANRDRPEDERFRQRALDSMRLTPDSDGLMDAIVRQLRLMFGTSDAHINIIDGPVQWQKATTAAQPLTSPREISACTHAIQSDQLTVINDTERDARLDGSSLFRGPNAIRFYAGYPIRSWDGHRIGMLCITDTQPRSMQPDELTSLRDFANRVEQELWSSALRPN